MVIFVSCKPRVKLNADEQRLTEEIRKEEQAKQEAEAANANTTEIIDSLSRGFRFREERSVDPQNPPVTIDLAGSLDNIREIKLSDVAQSIEYVPVQPVPDIPHDLKFKYYQLDDYIVATNLYGIHLYSNDGSFIRSVVKNELNEVYVDQERNRIQFWGDYTLIGGKTSVWGRGNKLYYNYTNTITGQEYIMEYDCSSVQVPGQAGFDPERMDQVTGLGEIQIDLNHGNTIPPEPREHRGIMSIDPDSYNKITDVFSPDNNTYIKEMGGDFMWGVFNGSNGDTLSTFTKHEQVVNYTNSVMRGTDSGIQYEKQGELFFRTDFNDTIFHMVSHNQIVPVYVLNLGQYKVSKQEGVDPGVSLEGKIIPEEWAETEDYIFMTFTKDDYDSPANRRDKSVKIYHALFFKRNQELAIIEGDPFEYDSNILENDMDGGLPVWPLTTMVGKNNELLIPLKGKELKAHVRTAFFQNSGASATEKRKLEQLASSAGDNDDIIMKIILK